MDVSSRAGRPRDPSAVDGRPRRRRRTVDRTDAAIDAALDLSAPARAPLELPAPADYEDARERAGDRAAHRLVARADGERRAPRRGAAGVVLARPLRDQHRQGAGARTSCGSSTSRSGSTRPATSPSCCRRSPATPRCSSTSTASRTSRGERNENFGRECLELFTMGRDGGYTQDDVVEASRAFTGWVVDIPGRPAARRLRGEPWTAVFLPQRHDAGTKTLLGKTGTVRHGRRARRDPRATRRPRGS